MGEYLLLARHGSVEESSGRGFLGRTDAPLSEKGYAEARALAEVVRGRKPERIVSSPLTRATQTAAVVAEAAGLEVETDADLREIDFGEWEGRTFEEIQADDPEAVSRWAEFSPDFAPPGGEVIGDFFRRARRALARLAGDPADMVLAVTHGGVIRTAICQLLGLDARSYLLFDVRPASLTTIRIFDGKGILTEMRSVDSLEGS